MIAILEDLIKKEIKEDSKQKLSQNRKPSIPLSIKGQSEEKPLSIKKNEDFSQKADLVGWAWFLAAALLGMGLYWGVHMLFTPRTTVSPSVPVKLFSQVELDPSLVQMRATVNQQEKKIQELSLNLKAEKSKAVTLESVRGDYQKSLLEMKTLYEARIADLQNLLKKQGEFMKFIEAHLTTLQTLMGRSSEAAKPIEANKELAVVASGEVALVDARYGFLIITIGSNRGVSVGKLVQIYQKNELIGKARIERVYPESSAATVISETTLDRVQKGDGVRLVESINRNAD